MNRRGKRTRFDRAQRWGGIFFGLAVLNFFLVLLSIFFPSGFARYRFPPELLVLAELVALVITGWYIRKVDTEQGEATVRKGIVIGTLTGIAWSFFILIIARTPWNPGIQAIMRTPIAFLLTPSSDYSWITPGFSFFALLVHLLFVLIFFGTTAYSLADRWRSQQHGTWGGMLAMLAFVLTALPLTSIFYFIVQATGGTKFTDSFTLWTQIYMGVLPFEFLLSWIVCAICARLGTRKNIEAKSERR